MGAWYWLFTIIGECVESSEIGTMSKIETHGVHKNHNNKFRVFGVKQDGTDPLRIILG